MLNRLEQNIIFNFRYISINLNKYIFNKYTNFVIYIIKIPLLYILLIITNIMSQKSNLYKAIFKNELMKSTFFSHKFKDSIIEKEFSLFNLETYRKLKLILGLLIILYTSSILKFINFRIYKTNDLNQYHISNINNNTNNNTTNINMQYILTNTNDTELYSYKGISYIVITLIILLLIDFIFVIIVYIYHSSKYLDNNVSIKKNNVFFSNGKKHDINKGNNYVLTENASNYTTYDAKSLNNNSPTKSCASNKLIDYNNKLSRNYCSDFMTKYCSYINFFKYFLNLVIFLIIMFTLEQNSKTNPKYCISLSKNEKSDDEPCLSCSTRESILRGFYIQIIFLIFQYILLIGYSKPVVLITLTSYTIFFVYMTLDYNKSIVDFYPEYSTCLIGFILCLLYLDKINSFMRKTFIHFYRTETLFDYFKNFLDGLETQYISIMDNEIIMANKSYYKNFISDNKNYQNKLINNNIDAFKSSSNNINYEEVKDKNLETWNSDKNNILNTTISYKNSQSSINIKLLENQSVHLNYLNNLISYPTIEENNNNNNNNNKTLKQFYNDIYSEAKIICKNYYCNNEFRNSQTNINNNVNYNNFINISNISNINNFNINNVIINNNFLELNKTFNNINSDTLSGKNEDIVVNSEIKVDVSKLNSESLYKNKKKNNGLKYNCVNEIKENDNNKLKITDNNNIIENLNLPYSKSQTSSTNIPKLIIGHKQYLTNFIYLGIFTNSTLTKYYKVNYRIFILDKDRHIIDFLIDDITQSKLSEKLEVETKIKQKLFSRVAHEFKTPIYTLISLVNELKENVENKLYSNIEQVSNYITSLSDYVLFQINDIIYYSNNESIQITLEDICLEEVISFCNGVLQALVAIGTGNKSKVSTKVEFDKRLYCVKIKTDRFRLKQIILNFISNAVKFTKYGEITLKAGLNADNKEVSIKVIDTGIGIDKKAVDAILKNDNDLNNMNVISINLNDKNKCLNQMGTGLGLNISKTMMKSLGHKFNVSSDPRKGSTFEVIINGYELVDIKEEEECDITSCTNQNHIYNYVNSLNNISIKDENSKFISPILNSKKNVDNKNDKLSKFKDIESNPTNIINTTENIYITNNTVDTNEMSILDLNNNKHTMFNCNNSNIINSKNLMKINKKENLNNNKTDSFYNSNNINQSSIISDRTILYKDENYLNFFEFIKDINTANNINNKHINRKNTCKTKFEVNYTNKYYNNIQYNSAYNINNQCCSPVNLVYFNKTKKSLPIIESNDLHKSISIRDNCLSDSLIIKPYKILIIDDSKTIRNSIKKLLIKDSKLNTMFDIIEGEDGVETLNLVVKDQFDGNRIRLIISDENMEYLNGSDSYKILKKLERLNKINNIFLVSLTAYVDQVTTNEILSNGADLVLLKPLSSSGLKDLINKFDLYNLE